MTRIIQLHREALRSMLRDGWKRLSIAVTQLDNEGVRAILPLLQREGVTIRILVDASPDRLADGTVQVPALHTLRALPGCEVRTLSGLGTCVYVTDEGEQALVTAAPLTVEALDNPLQTGILLTDSREVADQFQSWWLHATPLTDGRWTELSLATASQLEARSIADEIRSVGLFVRVSVRGTRRTRRLDPREYGVPVGAWGITVRPVELSLYKLDDVIRAKDELEAILAEQGVEWNGYYFMPHAFVELDWPRIFGLRQRQLRDRLVSPDGKAALKAQLNQARADLESFFREIYPHVVNPGLAMEPWVDQQVTRVLAEAVSGSIVAESGLEYRILTIVPEDGRSVAELQRILQDPKLRSVQLTFQF